MAGDANELKTVAALRDRHIGRLLLRAHRAFSARAVAKLHERGYAGISLAHIALLPHLDEAGTRVTTLAERAGMTKQGMGQLVGDLERQGYVERTPDPSDARATLVRFTGSGRDLLGDAVEVTQELEQEYAALLGREHLDDLRAMLRTIAGHETTR
ncbi:MAG: winged helix-turn-helix transcriptional regulator [Thermomicrobiales bacterium]|nr:winged helix-turn-helix transcriptional regulator [Thermomicrobiales bacterium]